MVPEILRAASPSSSRRRLIAVVDDDYGVLESLDDLLQAYGYDTLLSASAESFLELPARSGVAVLISDIGLPGMSGIDLLRTLQRASQCPPAILITGRSEALVEQDARDLGVLRLFLKPFDARELLATVGAQFRPVD